ncbi:DUF3761 domain-containing protein [Streptomyces sp. NPDC046759]|uniref:DUF3761 domain-containing protein n=1 Tax=Streptomyces sp. NPDC046759 TaxID=3155019 RepID=UPI0033C33A8A
MRLNAPPKAKDKYETAKCQDATADDSRHSQGTCSHHHGVRYWFKQPYPPHRRSPPPHPEKATCALSRRL